MRDRILDAAEVRARRGGYNAFSFREIAQDVGVSSAAIHYHFAAKADLAEALTDRYTERTLQWLGDPRDLTPLEAGKRVLALFRNALVEDDQMCLCGLFAAERDVLPPGVDEAVVKFLRSMLDFLRVAVPEGQGHEAPEATLAKLEGALIMARSMRDISLFDRATA
ncbi:TetR/AcrR family transcriptional regulator [Novosphingobium terrae]|uniref:TetR/AcrR family transcriptional regulator n=1 Tax=Novosphingobium terrae TaxID=2726189 RepID=UPI0019822EC2|nr:TetR/AcrR family transcriptional regulator [Novosphingobium terrae]